MGAWNDAIISQAGATMRVITASLTSAQILTLAGTPITVIPAPGPNKTITVLGSLLHFRQKTIAYAAGSIMRLTFGTGANFIWTPMQALADFTSGVDTFDYNGTGIVGAVIQSAATAINQPLLATVGGANFTTGDGNATLTVYYAATDVTIQ